MAVSDDKLRLTMAPLAVRKEDAARLLGMGPDSFERHVMREVRCVRRGSLKLYPIVELERWLRENSARLLD